MGYSSEGWFRNQFGFLRRQFLQEGELPFTNVLCEDSVAPALDAIEFAWKDHIYTPLVTLFRTRFLKAVRRTLRLRWRRPLMARSEPKRIRTRYHRAVSFKCPD